jgi:hypothetical protein
MSRLDGGKGGEIEGALAEKPQIESQAHRNEQQPPIAALSGQPL